MNKKSIDFYVGLFVLAGLLAVIFLAVQIGGQRFGGGDLVLQARFTDTGGLSEGNSVRIAGVTVGKVGPVELKPEQYVAMVTLHIDDNLELYDDTIASIRTSGLIGDKFVSLSPGGSGIPLESGDVIVDTESALDLESLLGRVAFGDVSE